MVWFVFLSNGISTFVDYSLPKAILIEGQKWYSSSHRWGDIFPHGISLKVNVIAQMEFRLNYVDVAAQHVSHYATDTPLSERWEIFDTK